jgi:hypothetical protein
LEVGDAVGNGVQTFCFHDADEMTKGAIFAPLVAACLPLKAA